MIAKTKGAAIERPAKYVEREELAEWARSVDPEQWPALAVYMVDLEVKGPPNEVSAVEKIVKDEYDA